MQHLETLLHELANENRYSPLMAEFAGDMHNIFEDLLLEYLTSDDSAALDGGKMLAICMKTFGAIAKVKPNIDQPVPKMSRLPSQQYTQHASDDA